MVVQIKGLEYTIGKIFGNDFVFSIPLYQRPYAWEKDQAEELFNDLYDSLGTDTQNFNDLNPYFLGSVVVIKEDHRPEAEVVDGQQRLTTLTIILSAIRSRLPFNVAQTLTQYIYEEGNIFAQTDARFRLTLRDRDARFFQDYIQKQVNINELKGLNESNLTDSQKNIVKNAMIVVDRLSKLDDRTCIRLAQFIIQKCFLVVVSTPDFGSAYRTFMVLNNRGKDLAHSDILKSEIIGNVPSRDQDAYGKRWEDTEELLGRDAFIDLFSHIRAIYRKLKLKDTVLIEFRNHVIKTEPDSMKLVDDVIIPFAKAYATIKDASYESASHAERINQLLKWLNRIDNTDWLPSAMLCLRRNAGRSEELEKVFCDLERLAAIRMILRTGINERIERYARIMTDIESRNLLEAPNSPLQLTDHEKRDALAALDGDIYNLLPKLRMYILLRLDSALAGGGATYQYDVITVEHVLPQNPAPNSQWMGSFPDAQERERMVHQLGNLVLLTRRKNSAAGNRDFDDKKRNYFCTGECSPFAITTQVVRENNWTPAVVRNRQKDLVARLKEVWRL